MQVGCRYRRRWNQARRDMKRQSKKVNLETLETEMWNRKKGEGLDTDS